MGDSPFSQIEHFVVLMLENRSFDHMLGFLDHRSDKFPRLKKDDPKFSNPSNPMKPRADLTCVSDDANVFLNPDPPHSHGSVIQQIHLPAFGDAKMNGFIAAYTKKAGGNEEGVPVIHWWSIEALGVILIAAISVSLALLAQLGPWSPLVVLPLAGSGAWLILKRSKSMPGEPLKRWWLLAAVIGLVGLSAIAWVLSEWLDRRLTFSLLAVPLAVGFTAFLWWKRRRFESPPKIVPNPGPRVMQCMKPEDRLPALAKLAMGFAVCTRWHCSVPGATWPNRNFVHAGTSDGTVDIEVDFYDDETIFDRLEDSDWRIYYDGLPQVSVFRKLWDEEVRRRNWREFSRFEEDIGDLPKYVFIEPCHNGPRSNSQHPGNGEEQAEGDTSSDFKRGDELVALIYELLRKDEQRFAKTAFVVTYDEHGGFYDHVPPPRNAIDPKPLTGTQSRSVVGKIYAWFVEQPSVKTPFKFTTLGPRVPTVIVSPLIEKHTCCDTLFDHTSIPRTVRKRFAPTSAPISAREEAAKTFDGLFTRTDPRTSDLPDLQDDLPPVTAFGVLEEAATPPGAWRDDEFAANVEDLASKLDEVIPQEVAVEQFGVLDDAVPRSERVAARFTAWAEEAQG